MAKRADMIGRIKDSLSPRLSPDVSRLVITLGILGFFLSFFSLFFLRPVQPVGFEFPINKNAIIGKAEQFLRNSGIAHDFTIRRARLDSEEAQLIYVQKALAPDAAQKIINELPLYFWQVTYSLEADTPLRSFFKRRMHSLMVLVNPLNGSIVGLRQKTPSEKERNPITLSQEEYMRRAGDFLAGTGLDMAGFQLSDFAQHEGSAVLEYRRAIDVLPGASAKIHLEYDNGSVMLFSRYLDVPAEVLEKYRTQNSYDLFLFFFLNALVFGIGVIIFIFSILQRKRIDWKSGTVYALLYVLTQLIYFLNAAEYRGLFLIFYSAVLGASLIFYFFWIRIVWGVGHFFAQQEKVTVAPFTTGTSLLVSYIFVFTGVGLTLLAFSLTSRLVQPVALLGFSSFFSAFPSTTPSCVVPVLLSLSAAVSEELFFRALLISYMKRFVKRISWCIVVASCIWSFIHVSPYGYSEIVPGFLKGIFLLPIGILFGYIFVRFGIVCAIATHYLYDLVVIGVSYSVFSSFSNLRASLIALLAAAAAPLFIAVIISIKKSTGVFSHERGHE